MCEGGLHSSSQQNLSLEECFVQKAQETQQHFHLSLPESSEALNFFCLTLRALTVWSVPQPKDSSLFKKTVALCTVPLWKLLCFQQFTSGLLPDLTVKHEPLTFLWSLPQTVVFRMTPHKDYHLPSSPLQGQLSVLKCSI